MRIAYYCPNKPLDSPHPSGDLVIARGIQASLNRLGHDCIEVSTFRARWFWRTARGWTHAFSEALQAYQRIPAIKPALWLTYHSYYKSPDILGPWISRRFDIPYVLFQPMYSTKRRKKAGSKPGFVLNRFALARADYAFTNNISDIDNLYRIIDKERIAYLAPGIYPEDFQYDAEARQTIRDGLGLQQATPLIMTAARFRPDVKFQSLQYLFKSLGLLRNKGVDFTFLIVGGGPMEHELRKMADRQLPKRTIFAGEWPRTKMAGYYSAADLFVFPGIGESLGMVYLEAQACGVPVVALRTAGVPQVVDHNETGLLVAKDDGQAMADAVQRLLMEPDTRHRMGARAAEVIRSKHNLHRNYAKLGCKLEAIAGGRQKPPNPP